MLRKKFVQAYFLTPFMQWLDVMEMEVLPGEHTEIIVKVSSEAQIRRFFGPYLLHLD